MDAIWALSGNIVNKRYEDLPQEVVEATKRSILDTLGVMLAATTTGDGCQQVVEVVREFGGTPESTVLGFGDRVPCYLAALANGAFCHPLDYDDTHDTAACHPTAETLPAALAVAERIGGASGRDLIATVALCNDLVSRLGLALTRPIGEHGWMNPALFGYFGGAAASAKLLGLTQEQMVDALGIAYCQVGGSHQMAFGTGSMVRAIRDGFSQKDGVLSALLAQRGVTGPKDILEGKAGLYNLYYRGEYNPVLLTADLGEKYEGINISIKPWPACRAIHPYVEAALSLMQEHRFGAADIEKVVLGVHELTQSLCEPVEERRHPKLGIDAKYSLPFSLAAALVQGKLVIANFLPQGLHHAATLSMAEKITYRFDPALRGRGVPPAVVEITLRDGRALSKRVDIAYGHPTHPIQREDLIAKFRDCVQYSAKHLSPARVEELVERISGLEAEADIRPIVRLAS